MVLVYSDVNSALLNKVVVVCLLVTHSIYVLFQSVVYLIQSMSDLCYWRTVCLVEVLVGLVCKFWGMVQGFLLLMGLSWDSLF